MLKSYNERINRIQNQYAAIYGYFGGDPASAPSLADDNSRRPMLSRIKVSISKLPALYNPADYSISKLSGGTFAVHLEPELVYVRTAFD